MNQPDFARLNNSSDPAEKLKTEYVCKRRTKRQARKYGGLALPRCCRRNSYTDLQLQAQQPGKVEVDCAQHGAMHLSLQVNQ